MAKNCHIYYHAHCFDGVSSAAVMANFLASRFANSDFQFTGLGYSLEHPYKNLVLDPDCVNACVDFRFCPDKDMHWWIDHHISAFFSPEDQSLFEERKDPQHIFDPTIRSCVELILSRLASDYQYEPNFKFAEFMRWAAKIDSADFSSPHEAVDLSPPAMKLAAWLRSKPCNEHVDKIIRQLGHQSLEHVSRLLPGIKEICKKQTTMVSEVRQKAELRGNVVVYHDSSENADTINKLALYVPFPEAPFSVGSYVSEGEVKVSVGYNPWSKGICGINIGTICQSYGGGGHPYVGGISFATPELASVAINEIVTLLNNS